MQTRLSPRAILLPAGAVLLLCATLILAGAVLLLFEILILPGSVTQPCGLLDEIRGKPSGCLQAIDPGGRGQAIHLTFSPVNPTLNVIQYDDRVYSSTRTQVRVAVFNLPNGRIARTMDLPQDGDWPIGELIDDEVRYGETLWNINTGKPSGVMPQMHTEGDFSGAQLLPGRRILVWNMAGAAVIYDRDSGDILQRVSDSARQRDSAVSDDGSTLAVGGDAAIEFFNLSTGQRSPAPLTSSSIPLEWVSLVTLSRDGKFLALTYCDGYARNCKIAVLESATGRELASFDAPAGKFRLALSPDASFLSVASYDKVLRVYSVQLKRELLDLTWGRRPFDNSSYVQGSAFSPDGRYFAIVWSDGLPTVFDVNRWRESAGIPSLAEAIPTVTPWPPRTRGPSPTFVPTRTPTVTPNPTVVSQAAQVQLAAAKQWPVVFSDTFDSNANRWPLREDNKYVPATAIIEGGVYRWTAHPESYHFAWQPPENRIERGDMYVAIDARRVSAPIKAYYGLVFREGADHESFYGFRINDDGQCEFDTLWGIVEQTHLSPSSAIRPGEWNRLAVLAQGKHISLFINDQFVSVVDGSRFTSGGIGVTFDMEGNTDNVFEFDNLEVRAP